MPDGARQFRLGFTEICSQCNESAGGDTGRTSTGAEVQGSAARVAPTELNLASLRCPPCSLDSPDWQLGPPRDTATSYIHCSIGSRDH
jgi:hypothetical protein